MVNGARGGSLSSSSTVCISGRRSCSYGVRIQHSGVAGDTSPAANGLLLLLLLLLLLNLGLYMQKLVGG